MSLHTFQQYFSHINKHRMTMLFKDLYTLTQHIQFNFIVFRNSGDYGKEGLLYTKFYRILLVFILILHNMLAIYSVFFDENCIDKFYFCGFSLLIDKFRKNKFHCI